MKKILNMVIGGLEQKIFNLVLFSIVLVAAAFMAAAVYQSRSSAALIDETGSAQKEAIEETSLEIMEQITDKTLSRTTDLEAVIAENLFDEVSGEVSMLADFAGGLYVDRARYDAAEVSPPDPAADGTVSLQLLLQEGTDPDDEAVAEKIGLFANLGSVMSAVFENIENLNSCFIGFPEGALLIVDETPSGKYSADGKLLSFPVTDRSWYTGAVETGGLYFTGVEKDSFSDRIGIVCSEPVYIGGEFLAVVGIDLFLDSMAAAVEKDPDKDTYSVIIGSDGKAIFSSFKKGLFAVELASEAADLTNTGNEALSAFLEKAGRDSTAVELIETEDGAYYMAGAPIPSVGWTLISMIERERMEEPSRTMISSFDEILDNALATAKDKSWKSRLTIQVLLLICAILALSAALALAKRIVKPLNAITRKVSGIGDGNIDFVMEEEFRTGDELEVLAESFAGVTARTRRYIRHITEITAEKERISTELSLARQIQENMLPNIFPPFPERTDLDIYASMAPAREVGGDFYDFFLIDDDHLAMVIADVAGKGIPAALFMMMSKILLNSIAMLDNLPDSVLRRMNEQVCQYNEAEMFVTVWLGVLTISTGHVAAANAGHEYPILRKNGGKFELVKDKHSFVIGALEGVVYKTYEFELEEGGSIFLYTDGVAEAANQDNEFFGTERMLEVLNRQPDASASELVLNMKAAVNEFVGDADQYDDLTILVVKRPLRSPEEV